MAQAVLEYLHDDPRLGCRTLFATHFHELADLADRLPGLRPVRLEVLEREDEVVFLHRVVPGGADRSYGVYVARLAGVPQPVADRAEALLAALESRPPANGRAKHPAKGKRPDPLRRRLESLDPLQISPVQALQELCVLREIALASEDEQRQ